MSGPDETTPRIGCTSVAYLRHPLKRALEGIAGCGIENVELASIPRYCEHLPVDALPTPEAVLGQCVAFGLRPVAISAHGDLKDAGDRKHIMDCMGLAADLGVAVVNTGTGGVASGSDEELILNAIGELTELGERLGVTLGLETQNDIATSAARADRLIERIGSDRLRLNLDPANIVYWSGRDALQEVRGMARFVAHMHVKDHRGGRGDYDFPRIGTGDLDLVRIISCLRGEGFTGVFVIEPEPSKPVAERTRGEVSRVREEPGLAYSEFHAYLGESDASNVDVELRASLAYLTDILDGSGLS